MADDTAPRQPNDRPKVRTWVVPTTYVNEQGEEVPAVENAQLALHEIAIILMRVGGVVSLGAKRVELPKQGRFGPRHETEFLLMKWESHSPATPKVEMGGAAAVVEESTPE